MVKRALALTFIVLVILVPATILASEPNVTPHENPEEAAEEIDSFWILTGYASVMNSILNLNFENSSSLMMMLNSSYVPQNLKYIFIRTLELLNETNIEIMFAKIYLDNATLLYSGELYADALREAAESLWYCSKANITIDELRDALEEFVKKLPETPLIKDKIVKKKGEVLELTGKLKELIHELAMEAYGIRKILEENKTLPRELVNTTITVNIVPEEAYLGSEVYVYGVLKAINGSVLGGRAVQVFIGNSSVAEAITNNDGFYDVYIRLPFVYVDRLPITVVYIPKGVDARHFRPCANMTYVNLVYFKTHVYVYVPEEAYPQIPFNIGITVDPSMVRDFKVYLDGSLILKGYTFDNGTYTSKLLVNTTGVHEVLVYVEPLGIYGPAQTKSYFEVVLKNIDVYVNAPKYVIIPLEFTVSGKVISKEGLNISNALVKVSYLDNVFTAKTSADGSFNVNVRGFILNLYGPLKLFVKVKPYEPWFESKVIMLNIYSLNLVTSLLATLAVSFSIATIVRHYPKHRKIVVFIEEKPTIGKVEEKPAVVKVKDAIISEFIKLLSILAEFTGLSIGKSETLREFLSKIRGKVGRTPYRVLEEIFLTVEKHLYSPTKIKDSKRIEYFKKIVREVIHAISGKQ